MSFLNQLYNFQILDHSIMQKTVVFGRKPVLQENVSPKFIHRNKCKNCERLQAQLSELSVFTNRSQGEITLEAGAESDSVKLIQAELLDLKEKYLSLKKRLYEFQRENDDLHNQNTKLNRQLKACRIEIKQLLKRKKEPLLLESQSEYLQSQDDYDDKEKRHRCDYDKTIAQLRSQQQTILKEHQNQSLSWKQKTQSLETKVKDQSDQIAKLRDLLMRRNRNQEQRHQILERVCS